MESAARAALSRALDRGPGLQRGHVDAKRWSGMANDHAVAVATRSIADPGRHQHADLFARIAGRSTCHVIDRRRLLLFSQGWMLLAAAALGLLTLEGMATPLAVLALSFALGVGAALNAPAWQAIVPELVGRDELTAAIRAQRDKLQSRARGRARARRPDCEPDGSGRYLLAQRGVVSGCDGGALPMAA